MLRQEFIEAIKRARDILRKPNFSLSDITTNNVVFIKNVKDSENVCETWCISQNIGIGEDTQVPTVVEEAFKVSVLTEGTCNRIKTKKFNLMVVFIL